MEAGQPGTINLVTKAMAAKFAAAIPTPNTITPTKRKP
jgi:hypothetical protein